MLQVVSIWQIYELFLRDIMICHEFTHYLIERVVQRVKRAWNSLTIAPKHAMSGTM